MTLQKFMSRLGTMFHLDFAGRKRIVSMAESKELTGSTMSYYSWMKELKLLNQNGACEACGMPTHLGRCLKA